MNNSDARDEDPRPESEREIVLVDLLRPVYRQGRLIWQGTALALAVTLLVGGLYLFRQPGRTLVSVGFRPTFDNAAQGLYPNGLPFAPTDIVAANIVQRVYAENNLQEYCELDLVRPSIFVQEGSSELQFLNLEFQSRLSDNKLTAIDRERLQKEYQDRRASMPVHYELSFVQPASCRTIPTAIAAKTLSGILAAWAQISHERRGVTNLDVAILGPGVFDPIRADNLLIRTDLLRTAVNRVIANIVEVQELPGSRLVRGGESNTSFEQLRARFEDLLQARLNPLVAEAGRRFGAQSLDWVEHALQSAEIRQRDTERRTEALRVALRDYSGVPAQSTPPQALSGGSPQSSGMQEVTPQIDRSFIDRIVEMSTFATPENITFRQEITRRSIEAAVEASSAMAAVDQYRQLRAALSRGGGQGLPADIVETRLNEIATDAKAMTEEFNQLYEAFSRVALNPGPALYQVDRPAVATSVRSFEPRDLLFVLLVVLLAAPLVLAVGVFAHFHARRLARRIG